MIILIHVLIALTSIATASFTFLKPSITKLIVSYGFILGTVGTGTYLILNASGNMLKTCIVGLVYLTVVSIMTIAAHVRLHNVQLDAQEN